MADLGNCGSLGNWFASLLLLAASLLAIIIYSVRRHKVDDYRGHYHVWLWAAACWFIMATDVAASLHQGLQQVMISATGTRIVGDGSIWWVVPALLLVGSIGSRLLIDMWSSRLSSEALILAAIAYITALVTFYTASSCRPKLPNCCWCRGCWVDTCCWPCRWGCTLAMSCSMPRGLLPKRVIEKKAAETGPAKKVDKAMATDDVVAGDPAANRPGDADEPTDAVEEPEDELGDAWVAVDPPHGGWRPVLKHHTAAGPLPSSQGVAIAGAARPGLRISAAAEGKLSKADRKAHEKEAP